MPTTLQSKARTNFKEHQDTVQTMYLVNIRLQDCLKGLTSYWKKLEKARAESSINVTKGQQKSSLQPKPLSLKMSIYQA